MSLLITGGAGYIGSQTALLAIEAGHDVVVVDDLSTGRADIVPKAAAFEQADVRDTARLTEIMRRHRVGRLIHFAASIVAPESVAEPLKYYANNVVATISLLQASVATSVTRWVFSSTAAVYGEAGGVVSETAPIAPVSPYGKSKAMAETILADTAAATGARATIFRYFNVAGADPEARAGQSTAHATHLIEIASQATTGRRDKVTIHGDDWPTRDGTGVRDYVHVDDLARAHLLALERMEHGADGVTERFNLGSGRGYSVREVIAAVSRAAGRDVPFEIGPRRPGDVAELIADPTLAHERLGWQRRYGLDDIAAHVLAWERRT